MRLKQCSAGMALAAAMLITASVSRAAVNNDNSGAADAAKSQPAETQGKDAKGDSTAAQTHLKPFSAERLGVMQRWNATAGIAVCDRNGHKLGRIDDLIVDLSSSEVLAATVGPAGIYGDFFALVPANAFSAADSSHVTLVQQTNLLAAPRLPAAAADPAAINKVMCDSCLYFKLPPMPDAIGGSLKLLRARRLAGLPVKNEPGEILGSLTDLMIDLPTSRIFFAVISYGGTNGIPYATPPTALTLDTLHTALMLELDRTKLLELLQHGDFLWTDMTNPRWVAATYREFSQGARLDSSLAAALDPGDENLLPKVADSDITARFAKPHHLTDSEITQKIVEAMVREGLGEAFADKQIQIVTVNGQVTLRGQAANENQTARLRTIAERVAGRGNVTSEFEAKK